MRQDRPHQREPCAVSASLVGLFFSSFLVPGTFLFLTFRFAVPPFFLPSLPTCFLPSDVCLFTGISCSYLLTNKYPLLSSFTCGGRIADCCLVLPSPRPPPLSLAGQRPRPGGHLPEHPKEIRLRWAWYFHSFLFRFVSFCLFLSFFFLLFGSRLLPATGQLSSGHVQQHCAAAAATASFSSAFPVSTKRHKLLLMPLLSCLPLQDFHTWQLPGEALSNITALQLLQQEPGGSFASSHDSKRQRGNKHAALKVSSRQRVSSPEINYALNLLSLKENQI